METMKDIAIPGLYLLPCIGKSQGSKILIRLFAVGPAAGRLKGAAGSHILFRAAFILLSVPSPAGTAFQHSGHLVKRAFISDPVKMNAPLCLCFTGLHQGQPFLCRRAVLIPCDLCRLFPGGIPAPILFSCAGARILLGNICPLGNSMAVAVRFGIPVAPAVRMGDLSIFVCGPLSKDLKAIPWSKAYIFRRKPGSSFIGPKASSVLKPLIQIKLTPL